MRKLIVFLLEASFFIFVFAIRPINSYAQSPDFDGVPINRNESCVLLVQNYYQAKFGEPKTWTYSYDTKKGVGKAFELFSNHPALLEQFPNGNREPPQHGDVLVFAPNDSNSQLGHVALVSGISNGEITFVQQNIWVGNNLIWKDSLPFDSHNRILTDSQSPNSVTYPAVIGWLHNTSGEELVLGESRTVEYGSKGQIKFKANSGGKFQVRLDNQTVLEGSDSGETDWRSIEPGKHELQFWVQRYRVGFLDYFYQPDLFQPIAGPVNAEPPSNPVVPNPITITPQTNQITTITPQSPLGKPSLSNPGNGATLPQTTDVTLSWNPSPSATQYKVELWGGPYNSVMTPCDGRGDTFCHIGQMQPGTMSWHVKVHNSNGQESDWSDTWSFTIGQVGIITITPTTASGPPDTSPNQFNLVSPFGNQQFRDGTLPNLQWRATTDADGDTVRYQVMIYNANSPDARLPGERDHFPSDWLTGTSWQPVNQGLEIGGRYTWYVNADDGHGHQTTSIDRGSFEIVPHRTSSSPCPAGVGPGPTVYKAGDYDPNKLTQQEKDWLWHEFGHDSESHTAPDGYGGERCGEPAPAVVVPPPPTNTSVSTLAPAIVPTRLSPTPTNTTAPPTYTPTFTPIPTPTLRPCPPGAGPGPTVYKAGDYDPNKITQPEKNWLWKVFGHVGDRAPDGYGGERCQ